MAIEPFDLILIALFTGIGNAIGQPIGKWVWKAVEEHSRKIKTKALKLSLI